VPDDCFADVSGGILEEGSAWCKKKMGYIGVARGALGARAPPLGRRKFFIRPNLQEKVLSAPPSRECTPEAEQESIFSKFGRCGRWERLFR